ncbi:ABC transporter substrate-binding protein [Mesorhizobium sp. A623]
MIKATRRTFLAGVGAGAVLSAGGAAFAQDSNSPIRLGCIAPLSGAQEVLGAPMRLGAEIAAKQINSAGGVLGRQIEIVARDDKASGPGAVAGAQDLFGQDIHLLFGSIQTAAVLAIMPLLGDANAILISCAAIADSLTHENFVGNYFRVSDNSYMRYRALARVMAEKYPEITTWTGVFPDAAYAFSSWDAFRDGLNTYYPELAKKDVTILDPVLTKFGATDFKPQLSTLMRSSASGLFNSTNGADAVTLLAQGANFRISEKFKAIADGANEFNVPKALGKRMVPNFWTAMNWYFGSYTDIPMGKELYEEYVAATGDKFPLGYFEHGHAAVHAYANGIRRAGSLETEKIVAAMEGMTFETAMGPRTFRKEDHQAILDMNLVGIGPRDKEPGWEVKDVVKVAGSDLIEPPSPGIPVKYNKL